MSCCNVKACAVLIGGPWDGIASGFIWDIPTAPVSVTLWSRFRRDRTGFGRRVVYRHERSAHAEQGVVLVYRFAGYEEVLDGQSQRDAVGTETPAAATGLAADPRDRDCEAGGRNGRDASQDAGPGAFAG